MKSHQHSMNHRAGHVTLTDDLIQFVCVNLAGHVDGQRSVEE